MKKVNFIWLIVVVALFAVFALGSGESETKDQGSGSNDVNVTVDGEIGDYTVVIDSCRLAKDYMGEPVVIVKYVFTNVNDDEPAAFYLAFDDNAYQNGVGLNEAYVLEDNANYSADNQTKAIKKGASIEVEVAYELDDTKTNVEVEVEELFSFNDTKITKTFSIQG